MEVENFDDGEEVVYPLVLLTGSVPPGVQDLVVDGDDHRQAGQAHCCGRRFKVLVLLRDGDNVISLTDPTRTATTTIRLVYAPLHHAPLSVRLVYLLSADGDGTIQAPDGEGDDVSMDTALKRVEVAGKLIQCATAEMMRSHFLSAVTPRTTFALQNEVYIHLLSKTTKELHAMGANGGQDLWGFVLGELADTLPPGVDRASVIDAAIMSFSRFDSASRKVLGHTALGGGPLALFGSASCFAWPDKVENVVPAFLDSRKIDGTKVLDDSCGRPVRWALASTTIGATLHELGHCLALPHVRHTAGARGGGIMNRGFDHFSRLFVLEECGSAIKTSEEPFWDRSAAVRLRYQQFMYPRRSVTDGEGSFGLTLVSPEVSSHAVEVSGNTIQTRNQPLPTPLPNAAGAWMKTNFWANGPALIKHGTIAILHAPSGIAHVSYIVRGDCSDHDEFEGERPKSVVIHADESALRQRCGASEEDDLEISITDSEGNIAQHVLVARRS